jgi:oxygen-independent coproporphyrinogen-3 oxidase
MDLVNQAGLYLHIPFCPSKCRYCSFFSVAPRPGETLALVAALRQQIFQASRLADVQSLGFATFFIGGGTPSMLPPETLADLLGLCRRSFPWSMEDLEISIEVNPGTIDKQGLLTLRRAGFNRLSIGIQSLDDGELRRLGRIHNRDQALATVNAARQAGFDNLSCDLMYGLPGQSPASWSRTLEQILGCAPQHLSLYELAVEEGTPLWDQVESTQCVLPPEEDVLAMMSITQELTGQGGLARYEISNYACSGFQCRHNLNYWDNGVYLGLGPGAVSMLGGKRKSVLADVRQYCRLISQGRSVWVDVEQLDREAAFRETVVMGLRMLAGISAADLSQRFGLELASYYGSTLDRLVSQGLLRLHDGQLQLTARGLPLANRVMAELV